jgi:hypothetical protein
MMDYLFTWANEIAAKSDPVVGPFFVEDADDSNGGAWRADETIPNIFLWNDLYDTTETVTGPDGEEHDIVVHHPFDFEWRVLVSVPEPRDDMASHTNIQCIGNRETQEVLWGYYPPETNAHLHWQPIFHGAEYILGAQGGLV